MNAGVALKVKSFHTMLDGSEPAALVEPGGAISVDRENRTIKFVAQTEKVDCEKQVVTAAGMDPAHFFQNRRVFIDHEYDIRSYVGTLRAAVPWNGTRPTKMGAADHTSWWVKVFILPSMRNPICDDILTMAEHGGIGTSLGYDRSRSKVRKATVEDRERWGKSGEIPTSVMYYTYWIEQTITAMPCNGDCQSIDPGKAAKLEWMLGKGMIQRASAECVGFPPRARRKILVNIARAA